MIGWTDSLRSQSIRLRAIANAVNCSTFFGLAIARIGKAQLTRGPRGLWYAEGYALPFPMAGAFAVGNVIITSSTIAELGGAAVDHEERHTWQYVLCGALFLPLYVTAMGWSWIRTGDRAARNIFERTAGLAEGGYSEIPVRPLLTGFKRRVSGSGQSPSEKRSDCGGAHRGADEGA